jgi:hypothetical protein
MAQNDGGDEGNRRENREELPSSVLQLQKKMAHMSRRPDEATTDERRGGRSQRRMADDGLIIRGGRQRS